MSLSICRPVCDAVVLIELRCPTCEAERPMMAKSYEWYGWTHVCLGCGDAWQDGERLDRPFKPKWRKERVARALLDLHNAEDCRGQQNAAPAPDSMGGA